MFHLFKNRRARTVKVRSQRYIKNVDEPVDNPDHDSLNKDETVLGGDSPVMRRRFRGVAKRMRIIKDLKHRKDLSK